MATLCLSNGVPMITAGDERGRTQRGNNNAYCQDNEISWIDWRPDDAWLDVYELTRAALRLRREHPALRQRHWFEGTADHRGGPKDLAWLHPPGREMTGDDWHDDASRVVGMFVSGDPLRSPGPRGEQQRDKSFMIWLNAGADDRRRRRCPRTRGCTAARSCSPPTPTCRSGHPVEAGDEPDGSGGRAVVGAPQTASPTLVGSGRLLGRSCGRPSRSAACRLGDPQRGHARPSARPAGARSSTAGDLLGMHGRPARAG